jgi:O-antigen ligase
VETLSPGRRGDFALAASGNWAPLSLYPHATLLNLIKLLAYLGGFTLAAYTFDFRKPRSILLRGLIVLGVFEAAYGIVQYLAGWQKIFTYEKRYGLQEASGTYINRNHFVGLLELILPFVVASAFYSFQVWSSRGRGTRERGDSTERTSAAYQTLFYSFLIVVMMVALIFSLSRMGVVVAAFTVVLISALAQLKVRRSAWLLGVVVFLACVVGYGLWIGLSPLLVRFETMSDPGYLRVEGRMAIWSDALRLIRDYPLVGTGLGTFAQAFPRYQTVFVNSRVAHAHNDYLEFASDTGLVGAALLFLPIFYLLGRLVLSFLDDPHRYRRAVTLGCIGSIVALLLHSAADFNLQIPANALIFAVILGIAYRVSCLDRRSEAGIKVSPT